MPRQEAYRARPMIFRSPSRKTGDPDAQDANRLGLNHRYCLVPAIVIALRPTRQSLDLTARR